MRPAANVGVAALALFAALAPPTAAVAAGARRALADGSTLFSARSYEAAARRFEEAAAAAAGDGLDPALARYDLGCALLGAGKAPEAAAAFAEASRSSDPVLGAKAHFNRGVALATAADAAETAGLAQGAIALLDQALGSYESAMRIDPNDEDPKVNHELAARKKAQLEQSVKDQEKKRGGGGQPPPPQPQPAEERRPGPQPGRSSASGNEMSPGEARAMLDAMKQQEMTQRSRIKPSGGESVPVDKAW